MFGGVTTPRGESRAYCAQQQGDEGGEAEQHEPPAEHEPLRRRQRPKRQQQPTVDNDQAPHRELVQTRLRGADRERSPEHGGDQVRQRPEQRLGGDTDEPRGDPALGVVRELRTWVRATWTASPSTDANNHSTAAPTDHDANWRGGRARAGARRARPHEASDPAYPRRPRTAPVLPSSAAVTTSRIDTPSPGKAWPASPSVRGSSAGPQATVGQKCDQRAGDGQADPAQDHQAHMGEQQPPAGAGHPGREPGPPPAPHRPA